MILRSSSILRRLFVLLSLSSFAGNVSAQEPDLQLSSSVQSASDEVFSVDRGPIDHLGHGTAEDLFVELGAGAKVSVFAGNLVVSVRPILRGDVLPDSQMALTYNHLDPLGSEALVEGWSYDLGRRWVAGAWGDRVLIDGDGFEDSFLAGPLPNRRELLELADDLVREWRRRTPIADRRAGGGERTFRQMIASDPQFFGEMRMRYLGPAKAERRAAYRSSRRGERTLVLDDADEYVVLTRHDGGRELYGKDGSLQEVEPAFGAPLRLIREGSLLAEVEVGGVSRYLIDSDSYGRMIRIRSGTATSELLYVDRYLHRLESTAGRYEMRYDDQGRLVQMDGPEGRLEVEYDSGSGRVKRARGPLGELRLGDLEERAQALEVSVEGSACGRWATSWSSLLRERRLDSGGRVFSVRFQRDRPLPVEWLSPSGRTFLEWSEDGRLLSVRRLEDKVTFERSSDGAITALKDLGGAQAKMVRGEQGSLLGWTDPAGRRTRLVLDSFLLPTRIEAPGGARLQIQRTRSGLLRQVDSAGHGSVSLRRDSRGLLRTVTSSSGAGATLQRDALGRVTGFDTPGGLRLELSYGVGGRVRGLNDPYSNVKLHYGISGGLDGWKTAREQVEIERSSTGQLEGLRRGSQRQWEVRRDKDGSPSSVVLADGKERKIQLDADGLPSGWQHAGGGRVVLKRDRKGRVVAWSDELLGDASLALDSWGRVSEVRRGGGRWRLERDRSGRVVTVKDPVSASTRLNLDENGRLQILSAPDRLTWHFKHDAMGKLIELRDGGQIWSLRHGSLGMPEVFVDPRGREVRLEWDSAGRWRALRHAGESIEAAYGELGPTRVGKQRRSYGEAGELLSWGEGAAQRGWRLERTASGEVGSTVFEDRTGGLSRELQRRSFQRDEWGRLRELGKWRLSWDDTGIRSLELEGSRTPLVRVDRDSVGRVSRFVTDSGRRAEVLRDDNGDVREFSLSSSSKQGHTFRLSRDSAARVVGLLHLGGAELKLLRDPLGRASQWELLRVDEPFQVAISPLDGTVPSPDKSLAQGLGVAEEALDEQAKLSGSRRIEVLLPGRREVLRFDEVRGASGALQAVTRVWESALGAWEPDHSMGPDLIGAQIASATEGRGKKELSGSEESMYWGGAPLLLGGRFVAPSLDGTGAQLSSDGSLRVSSVGRTVSWLSSGASLDGLQFPTSRDEVRSPPGWSSPSVELGELEGVRQREEVTLRGAASAVALWWRSLAGQSEQLASLPMGAAAVSRAWARPRQDIFSRSALLAAGQSPAGAGVGLPPLPGASRLLPGLPGSLEVTPLMALVLSGDLPLRAAEHVEWLPSSRPAWTMDLPGARQLLGLAEQRSAPAVPRSWRRSSLAGVSSLLSGFVTTAGVDREFQRAYDLRPALSGLPGGVSGVLPGPPNGLPVASASLPVHGRASAIEALSVDPLSPSSALNAQTSSDSMLLFLRAASSGSEPMGCQLPPLKESELWKVALPSGSLLVVDGLGRLLSIDGLGRLHRAWAEQAAAQAGIALLLGYRPQQAVSSLSSPYWLPSSQGLPEARWGLMPGRQDIQLLSDGQPFFLKAVLGSSPFSSFDSGSE